MEKNARYIALYIQAYAKKDETSLFSEKPPERRYSLLAPP